MRSCKVWPRSGRYSPEMSDLRDLYQQVIRALANLVESVGGSLWLAHDGRFAEIARVNMAPETAVEPADGSPVGAQ